MKQHTAQVSKQPAVRASVRLILCPSDLRRPLPRRRRLILGASRFHVLEWHT